MASTNSSLGVAGARLLLALAFGFTMGGCAGLAGSGGGGSSDVGSSGAGAGSGSGTGAPVPPIDGTGTAGSSGAAGMPGTDGTGGSSGGFQSGTLTAGTWDDNLNFDFYLSYLRRIDRSQPAGLPLIPRAGRLEIRVTDAAGAPMAGANVTVTGTVGKLMEAPTRGDGRVFFFPELVGAEPSEPLQIAAAAGSATAAGVAAVGDDQATFVLPGVATTPAQALDLALVIDTTGSMSDELEFLKVEMRNIVDRVARDFPGVAQRWGLILYKDTGDEYVVRSFNFTSSLSTFQTQLAAQSAGGGGDYPEAADQALARLTALDWSQSAVARMAFWIADAPHHDGREERMVTEVLTAQGMGIRVYPVAASGTNELLEYAMRTAAQVTGGRYLFLTDDSRVGNSHKEPTIPCYVVTTLDKAMIRMISMELSGVEIPTAAADVIRTGGNPTDGRCTLSDGQVVTAL